MELSEYHALARVERLHWFYQGKRELVRWWIDHAADLKREDLIVDAGAGTGELVSELSMAYRASGICVKGVEYVEEARHIAMNARGVELIAGSILEMPITDGAAKVSIALDVLEHVEDDVKALSELVRVTKPGGLVIINVPAFRSLWSDWDIALGHYRRYRKRDLRKLLGQHRAETEVLFFNYLNFPLFPAVLLYRKLAALLRLTTRAEDRIPAPWLNSMLRSLFVQPGKWSWLKVPFGTSLFCVLRKR